MSESILIRLASEADLASLVEFNQAMARETESRELDVEVLTSGVSFLLANPRFGYYVVAEDREDGSIAGSLMVTYEWSDWRNALFYWIQSVYVVPRFRRRSIYRGLYQFIKEQAARERVCGFRLYVEKENVVAQQTYSKLGMHESYYLMFEEECEPTL